MARAKTPVSTFIAALGRRALAFSPAPPNDIPFRSAADIAAALSKPRET
jgi:hypothetical protein